MKKLLLIAILCTICISSLQGFAYDTSNKNEGKVFTDKRVDTSIPSWFKPSNDKDINYRLGVLPLEKYRYHNQYIVIPSMGLVAPIVELDKTSADYKAAIKGKSFDYNKYLEGGPTIYPGTATIGKEGNTFIFGHSNYWIKKAGDFKTIFRLVHNVEKGDKIWVYKKIDGKWIFFEYTVTVSKKIGSKDVKYLLPEKGKTTITLSGCRPIGTARDRWMNRGELTYIGELDKVLNKTKPVIKPATVKTIKTIKK